VGRCSLFAPISDDFFFRDRVTGTVDGEERCNKLDGTHGRQSWAVYSSVVSTSRVVLAGCGVSFALTLDCFFFFEENVEVSAFSYDSTP
jgi:hypothetical protein